MMWFKLSALILFATLISACRVGPQLDDTDIGQQPYGANVAVELTRKDGSKREKYDGELVDVRDDGLVIGIRSDANDRVRFAFIPWHIVYSAKATDWSGYAMRHSYSEARRESSISKLRNISRFPQGLSPELLTKLLANSGQSALETIE